MEKEALEKFSSYAIVDDRLATGGTVDCVTRLINKSGKKISGLLTVVELIELNVCLLKPIKSKLKSVFFPILKFDLTFVLDELKE